MTAMGVPQKNFDYSGKTIIDCPSCGTRFCVKNELISKNTEPNFHCSKCDNVFRVDLSALKTAMPPKISEANTKDPKQTFINSAKLPEDSKYTQSKLFNATRSSQSDGDSSAPHLSVSAPHESTPFDDQDKARIYKYSSITGTNKDLKPRRQMRAIELLKNAKSFLGKSPATTKLPSDSPAHLRASSSNGDSWHDLLSISTPILIFLLTLSLITFYFVKNPATASNIISTIVPSSPRMAPNGLHITETEFSKITLDSGEEVAIISGEIQNKTGSKFGTVQLEAQAFNREGTLIKKSISSSGSALVNTRVKSLSPKMIESLQEAKGPKKLTIAPNMAEKFTVALLGDEINKAAYFSIRIFSVRAQG